MLAPLQFFYNRCEISGILPTGDKGVPVWVYILMGVSLVVIIALVILGTKSKKDENDDSTD